MKFSVKMRPMQKLEELGCVLAREVEEFKFENLLGKNMSLKGEKSLLGKSLTKTLLNNI